MKKFLLFSLALVVLIAVLALGSLWYQDNYQVGANWYEKATFEEQELIKDDEGRILSTPDNLMRKLPGDIQDYSL